MKSFLVIGMHRSATSLVAKSLHEQGVHMGSDLLGAAKGNPKGHFEHRPVITINDKILSAAGGSWNNIPPREAILRAGEGFTDEIRSVVSKEQRELFGFKDPRLVLTADLWIPHMPNPHLIFVYRNRADIANSLSTRDNMPFDRCMDIAKEYHDRMLDLADRYYG